MYEGNNHDEAVSQIFYDYTDAKRRWRRVMQKLVRRVRAYGKYIPRKKNDRRTGYKGRGKGSVQMI